MSELQISLVIILAVVAGVLVALLGILPYLKKKGINTTAIVKEVENKGELAEKVADIIKPLLPKDVTSAIDLIKKWGPIACGYSEQICHAGDIDKNDRAVVAENVVLNVLKQYNIVPDDNEKSLIDVTIKNAVDKLGHNNTSNIKEAGAVSGDVLKGLSDLIPETKNDTLKTVSLNEAKPEEIKPLGEINISEKVAPVENKVQVDTSTQALSPEDAQKIQDAMNAVHEIANKANIQLSK